MRLGTAAAADRTHLRRDGGRCRSLRGLRSPVRVQGNLDLDYPAMPQAETLGAETFGFGYAPPAFSLIGDRRRPKSSLP